ncbi:MAG: AzlD domain-containing protein [Inquilinus sp.]|nr:AzlD domain-containing protein [Inquilinus sp.]
MGDYFWLTVIAIAAATYLTRLLPLVLPELSRSHLVPREILGVLGPCLLAAMAATVLMPEIMDAYDTQRLLPLLGGLAFACLAMAARRDPGLATVAGVLGWWTFNLV